MFSIIMAIVPPIVLLIIMYFLDKKEKEPIPILLQFFALGALTIIPAIIVETIFGDIITFVFGEDNAFSTIVDAFFGIALVEEFGKWVALKIRAHKLAAYNCKFDGLVYVTFVTLGFATVENIFYVMDGGIAVALGRAITSIPGHLYFSIYMGFFMSKSIEAKIKSERGKAAKYTVLSIVLPTIFHGVYDGLLMLRTDLTILMWMGLVLVFYVFTLVFIIVVAKKDDYFVDPRIWICPRCKLTMYDKFCGQCGTAKVK